MRYDPFLLPTPESFEVLVHAILEAEHPMARVRRRLPPDWGLDIVREEKGERHGYQCKHYRDRNRANLMRAIRDSIETAVRHRPQYPWSTMTICISRDLTASETEELIATAQKYGLRTPEFNFQTGTSFAVAVARLPQIWDWATTQPLPMAGRATWTAGSSQPLVDTALRTLVARSRTLGNRVPLAQLLYDAGITKVSAVADWYEIAVDYYSTTRSIMRMMSFEDEVATFWMTRHSIRYVALNKELLSAGRALRRLFVFDFNYAGENPLAFRTLLKHVCEHERLGIVCKILDRDVFSETVQFECKIFAVQDQDNVGVFSPDGLTVTVVRDPDFVKDAIDVYEELFNHPEARKPDSLLV